MFEDLDVDCHDDDEMGLSLENDAQKMANGGITTRSGLVLENSFVSDESDGCEEVVLDGGDADDRINHVTEDQQLDDLVSRAIEGAARKAASALIADDEKQLNDS